MEAMDTVIQGGSDMGRRVSEDELQQALDFCGKAFAPTGPDEYRATERVLAERFKGGAADNAGPEITDLRFLDPQTPVIDPQIIETVIRDCLPSVQRPASDIDDTTVDLQSNARNSTADSGCEGLDVKAVLKKANARRVLQCDGVHNFEEEPMCRSGTSSGWVARLEKGKLGLVMPELIFGRDRVG